MKADAFKFDVSDAGGNLNLFMSVLDKLGVKLDGDQLMKSIRRFMMRLSAETMCMRRKRRSNGIRAEGDSSSVYFMNYYDALNYIIEERDKKDI